MSLVVLLPDEAAGLAALEKGLTVDTTLDSRIERIAPSGVKRTASRSFSSRFAEAISLLSTESPFAKSTTA